MTSDLPPSASLRFFQPLKIRRFRLLWLGSILSFIGGQLTLIAFPWLVLTMTGDPLAMGGVLAVAGIPRALFMLFGGALTDRFSALTVMICANWVRLVLMFGLSALVYSGAIEMWMVFVIAFIFGSADAFYWPASSAIVPKLLPTELLPAGNSLLQGLGQISQMLGPVLAGIIIASFAAENNSGIADLLGISVVFLMDGCGFVVSLIALSLIRFNAEPGVREPFRWSGIIASILEGFQTTWNDMPLRVIVIMFAIFSLFFRGPYLVGIPFLADTRFEDGALAYGLIASAFGVGALIGLVLAGSIPKFPEKYLGLMVLVDFIVLGSGFIAYALTDHVEVAMFFSALGGITDGFMVVLLISWLQVRVPINLLGRVMSVIMLFNMGLTPITAAVAGALIRWSLYWVFMGAGCILIGLSILGLMIPVVRQLGLGKRGTDADRAI